MSLQFNTVVASFKSENIGMHFLNREFILHAMALIEDDMSVHQYALPPDLLQQVYAKLGLPFPPHWVPQAAIPGVAAQLDADGVVAVAAVDAVPARGPQRLGPKPSRDTLFVPAVSAGNMTGPKIAELTAATEVWKLLYARLVSLKAGYQLQLPSDYLKELQQDLAFGTLDARGLYERCSDRFKMTKQDVPLIDELLSQPPTPTAEAVLHTARAFVFDKIDIAALFPAAYPKTNEQILDLVRDACSSSKIFMILLQKLDDRFPADSDKTLPNLLTIVDTHFLSVFNQCERAKSEGIPSAHATRAVSAGPIQHSSAPKQQTCDKWVAEIGGCTDVKCRFAHPPGAAGSQPGVKRLRDRIKQLQDAAKANKQPAKGKGRQPARGDAKRGKSGSAASAAGGGGGAASAAPASDEEEDYDA